jgi:cytochrome c oxidase subunit II
VMNSVDVIHSFYIPAFRTKQDVVPGRYSNIWFRAEHEGNYQVFCAEYCGDGHSAMMAKIHVVSREKFEDWLSNDPYKGLAPAQVGQKVYAGRCTACHDTAPRSVKNTKLGPNWGGIFGSTETIEGGTVKVDENYLRESILNPNAKIVKGFPSGVMPTQAGQLSESEISGVIEYIKSLK